MRPCPPSPATAGHRVRSAALAVLVAAAAIAVTASPAAAGAPPCATTTEVAGHDTNTSAASSVAATAVVAVRQDFYALRQDFYAGPLTVRLSPWTAPDPATHSTVTAPAAHPGTSPASTACWLAAGSRGPAVTAVQQALNACYGTTARPGWGADHLGRVDLGVHVAADGIYGPHTHDALRTVQRHLHIRVDGIYGPQTASRMRMAGHISPSDGQGAALCHTATRSAP